MMDEPCPDTGNTDGHDRHQATPARSCDPQTLEALREELASVIHQITVPQPLTDALTLLKPWVTPPPSGRQPSVAPHAC